MEFLFCYENEDFYDIIIHNFKFSGKMFKIGIALKVVCFLTALLTEQFLCLSKV